MISKRQNRRRGSSEGELHHPSGLPPIWWLRKQSRINLDGTEAANGVLRLKGLLLTSELRKFLHEIVDLNKGIRLETPLLSSPKGPYSSLIERLNLLLLSPEEHSRAIKKQLSEPDIVTDDAIYEFKQYPYLADNFKDWLVRFDKTWGKAIKKYPETEASLRESIKEMNGQSLKVIKSISDKLQEKVEAFESEHEVDFSLLDNHIIYVCPDCKATLGYDKFKKWKCTCGTEITAASETEQVAIKSVPLSVTDMVVNNIWFEEGVAYQLRTQNFDVYTGYSVMGGSGVLHEIDVLAERPKQCVRVFVECKARRLGIGDVFNLAGKMRDTGVAKGLICSTEADINVEAVRIGKANGIELFYDVLDKPKEFWSSLI